MERFAPGEKFSVENSTAGITFTAQRPHLAHYTSGPEEGFMGQNPSPNPSSNSSHLQIKGRGPRVQELHPQYPRFKAVLP